MSGWAASHCIAWRAQAQGTIRVVDVTTPAVSERVIAALAAWHIPKSSALMINRRASPG
jgi:hypothetical protein